jgi:hypothetical protein
MDLLINLKSIETARGWSPSERALIACCKTTLNSPMGVQKKAKALSEHIYDFVWVAGQYESDSSDSEEFDPRDFESTASAEEYALQQFEREHGLWMARVWQIMFEIVACIPPYHMGQDAFLHCVAILSASDEPIPYPPWQWTSPGRPTLWSDLTDIDTAESCMSDRGAISSSSLFLCLFVFLPCFFEVFSPCPFKGLLLSPR